MCWRAKQLVGFTLLLCLITFPHNHRQFSFKNDVGPLILLLSQIPKMKSSDHHLTENIYGWE